MPTARCRRGDFAPTSQADQPQWPKWGQYLRDQGRGRRGAGPARGEAADGAVRAVGERDLDRGAGRDLGRDARDLHQPVLHAGADRRKSCSRSRPRKTLRNVPDEALFNWEPRASSASTGRTRSGSARRAEPARAPGLASSRRPSAALDWRSSARSGARPAQVASTSAISRRSRGRRTIVRGPHGDPGNCRNKHRGALFFAIGRRRPRGPPDTA